MTSGTVDTEARHEVTDRYTVSLINPHLQSQVAARSQEDLATLLALDPVWPLVWAATLLHTLIATLPDEDPWRCLAGRRVPLSVADALDLQRVSDLDLSRDLGLAAVADPPTPGAVALLAGAGHSTRSTLALLLDAARRDQGAMGQRAAAPKVVDTVDCALRWALHRRASYCGLDDPYPWIAAGAAQEIADHAVATGVLTSGSAVIEAGRIESGTYATLAAVATAIR